MEPNASSMAKKQFAESLSSRAREIMEIIGASTGKIWVDQPNRPGNPFQIDCDQVRTILQGAKDSDEYIHLVDGFSEGGGWIFVSAEDSFPRDYIEMLNQERLEEEHPTVEPN
jgi:hypothetical protein